jgi:hypothetical protein
MEPNRDQDANRAPADAQLAAIALLCRVTASMSGHDGTQAPEPVEVVLGETQRRFLLLIAEANNCSVPAAVRMIIDEAIDSTPLEQPEAASLRWLLQTADRFAPDPAWLARFG